MTTRPTIAVLAIPLLLAGCGDDSVAPDNDERTASGEVLEGSISDAMLSQETLTSQPPLAADAPPPQAGAETADGAETGDGATVDQESGAAEATTEEAAAGDVAEAAE